MKKNISFLLALALVLSAFSGVFAAAGAEKETETETVYADSAELEFLKAMNFIDDDYTESNEKISRAEAVSKLMEIISLGGLSGENVFSDVAEESEYYGAIYEAYERDYINGTGGGKFDPEEPLEALHLRKIIIDILGYKNYASYVGYDKADAKLSVLKGAETDGGYITKKGFVKAVYNMLHSNYPEVSGMDADGIVYEFDSDRMFLNKFDIYKSTGTLQAVDFYSLSGEKCGLGYAVIDGEKFEKGEDLNDVKIGNGVKYYYKSEREKELPTLLYMTPYDSETLELNLEDVFGLTAGQIRYYDANGKTKTKAVSLSANLLLNYSPMSPFDPSKILGKEGKAFVITKGASSAASTVLFEIGTAYFVSFADDAGKIIYDKRGLSPLDLEDYENIKVISNKEEIEFSQIPAMSVATVYLTSENVSEKTAYIYISSAKFAGKISKTSDENEYTIYDKVYKTEASYDENRKKGLKYSPELSVGTTAMFYIDVNEKIVAADAEGYDGYTYGLLVSAGEKGKLDKTVMLRIFDANEKFETYDCNEKITYNGKRIKAETALADFEKSFNDGASKCKLIKFSLSDSGKINELITAYSADESNKIEFNHEYIHKTAYRDANLLQDTTDDSFCYGLMTSTVMFQAPEDFAAAFRQSYEKKDFSLYSISDMIEDDVDYMNTQVYDADDAKGAKVVVLRRPVSENYTQNPSFMYVNTVENQKRNDEIVPALSAFYKGVEGTYFGAEAETLKEIKEGDVIQPILNSNGEIKYLKVVFRFSDTQPDGSDIYKADHNNDGTKESLVTQYSGKQNMVTVGTESGNTGRVRNTCVSLYGNLVARNDYGFTATFEGNTFGDIPYFRLMTNYIMVCETTKSGHHYRTGSWDELRGSSPGTTDGSTVLLNTRNQKVMELLLIK